MAGIQNTTPVPNLVLDKYVAILKPVEFKVLCIIIRQTLGWIQPNNPGKRKEVARMATSFIATKTGCSLRSISHAIESLQEQELITVSNKQGSLLKTPQDRQGQYCLYYRLGIILLTTPTTQKHLPQKSNTSSAEMGGTYAQKLRIYKERIYKKLIVKKWHSRMP
jgi:hypothetical protein